MPRQNHRSGKSGTAPVEQTDEVTDRNVAAARQAGATRTNTDSTTGTEADADAVLDEIDEVLEGNAEEFVKGFVQKGGQ